MSSQLEKLCWQICGGMSTCKNQLVWRALLRDDMALDLEALELCRRVTVA